LDHIQLLGWPRLIVHQAAISSCTCNLILHICNLLPYQVTGATCYNNCIVLFGSYFIWCSWFLVVVWLGPAVGSNSILALPETLCGCLRHTPWSVCHIMNHETTRHRHHTMQLVDECISYIKNVLPMANNTPRHGACVPAARSGQSIVYDDPLLKIQDTRYTVSK
jgi:hypothetical protein